MEDASRIELNEILKVLN